MILFTKRHSPYKTNTSLWIVDTVVGINTSYMYLSIKASFISDTKADPVRIECENIKSVAHTSLPSLSNISYRRDLVDSPQSWSIKL